MAFDALLRLDRFSLRHVFQAGRRLVLACLVAGALAGCATTAPEVTSEPPREADRIFAQPRTVSISDPAASPHASRAEVQLRTAIDDWLGVPYRYGGTSRNGIDCSAFVQAVYSDVFGILLPRVTAEQVREGAGVRRGAYQPGDLVFFRPTSKGRHVGVYLGDGEFAHASTSQGVTISHLDDLYWRDVYWTTRRVLPDEVIPVAARPSAPARPVRAAQPPASRNGQRSGW